MGLWLILLRLHLILICINLSYEIIVPNFRYVNSTFCFCNFKFFADWKSSAIQRVKRCLLSCEIQLLLSPSTLLELVLPSADSGFSVYFESISLSEEFDGGCEDDFVQFGRDVFFITSYRSGRFCGNIQGDLRNWEAGNKNVTPMKERSYVELKDKEMDIWLKIIIPKSAFRIKTLEFLVTVLKKSCLLDNPEYQRCGPHPHCIQSHLFCDVLVNCALSDLPYGDFEL